MNFFYYLFYNQYAEIKGRGGDTSKAQFNTILLSTVLTTVYIITIIVIYGEMNPGFVEKYFKMGNLSGRTVGKILAIMVGGAVFFVLKVAIGTKKWYDKAVGSFERMSPDRQKVVAKKGVQYLLIAAIPIVILIIWAFMATF